MNETAVHYSVLQLCMKASITNRLQPNGEKQKLTLLVIAPHPDDEVISCGGLIARVKEEGGAVHVLFLTVATTKNFSNKPTSTQNERIKEIKAVAKKLNIDGWRIAFPGPKYHLQLDQVAQRDIIHEIEQGKKISLEALRPDILVFPLLSDYNQDHRAAAAAALTACRPAPHNEKFTPSLILSYESPMLTWAQPTEYARINFFVKLEDRHLNAKVGAMELYDSQRRAPHHPRHEETLRTLAKLRGSTVGTAFAEGYYCHKAEW
jgi:LmbE family N-acetylglucosaminyl deacetylase